MTGDDVCAMLHISRRTLQTLRDEKLVPYTTIGGNCFTGKFPVRSAEKEL